jgi:hypothetical protein
MVPQASQATSFVVPQGAVTDAQQPQSDGKSAQQQLQQQLQQLKQPAFSQVPARQQPLPTLGVVQNGAVQPGQNIVVQPATQPVGTQMQATWVTAGVAGLQGGLGGSQVRGAPCDTSLLTVRMGVVVSGRDTLRQKHPPPLVVGVVDDGRYGMGINEGSDGWGIECRTR